MVIIVFFNRCLSCLSGLLLFFLLLLLIVAYIGDYLEYALLLDDCSQALGGNQFHLALALFVSQEKSAEVVVPHVEEGHLGGLTKSLPAWLRVDVLPEYIPEGLQPEQLRLGLHKLLVLLARLNWVEAEALLVC